MLKILSKKKPYKNLEKCYFFTSQLIFLGYVVSSYGIQVDDHKIKAIREWPMPTSIQQVRSFHELTSFYRRFMRNYSSLITPVIEVLKTKKFEC